MIKFLKSFKYAFEGIASSIKSERNVIVHFLIMILVIISGLCFHISKTEWLICIILFGLVISAELMNTAIETTLDLCHPEKNDKVKLAKDVAAGSVLVTAISAAIIGLLIFIPKI